MTGHRRGFGRTVLTVGSLVLLALTTACGSGGSNSSGGSGSASGNASGITSANNYSGYSSQLKSLAGVSVDTSKYKTSGPVTIASIWQGPINGFGSVYKASMDYAAQQNKNIKQLNWYSGDGDVNKEITSLQNVVNSHPDAIILEPLDLGAMVAPVQQALSENIPVILCADGMQGTGFTSWVDIDLYKTGYDAATGLAKQMGGSGEVAMFNGIPGVAAEVIWKDAALAAFKKFPNIKVVAQYYDNWSIATARSQAADMISAHPDVKGIYAGGSEGGIGAIEAYAAAHKPMPMFGVNNVLNGFLRLAKQYNIKFTGIPDPPSMSALCLDQTMKVLNGDAVSQFRDVTPDLPGSEPFTQDDIDKEYQPTLSDDFVPPATAPIEFYKKAGL
jgi:ribose transport system substrate-binding protein